MRRRILIAIALILLAVALFSFPSAQSVAAGVALFLFGMKGLEDGFSGFGGGALERALERATASKARAFGFGVASTAVMQSSSLVTVITISFLSAGLMSLASGILVIFGANLGTTTGAWLMAAFGMKANLSAAAMPLLVFGGIFSMQRKQTVHAIGSICAGIGFLFLGIHFMKEGFSEVSESVDLTALALPGIAGLVVFTLVGAFMTIVMQSSHATLMLTIAALSTGQVTYGNALALTIGANIGTTISAVIGAAGSNARGRRLAAAHVVFNVVTGVLALALIVPLGALVDLTGDALGIGAENWTMKLAVFHSYFNILGVVVMWPFVSKLVVWLERAFRDKDDAAHSVWLNDAALRHPGAAVEAMLREADHLLDNAFEVLVHSVGIHRSDVLSSLSLDELVSRPQAPFEPDVLAAYQRRVKHIYSELFEFATEAHSSLSRSQQARANGVRVASRRIAVAVRAVTLMVPNLLRYGRGTPPEAFQIYQQLRRQIASAFRAVYRARAADSVNEGAAIVELLRREVATTDADVNRRLDELVRSRSIAATVATSIMNDSGHVFDIATALADAAEALYVVHEAGAEDLAERARDEQIPMHTGEIRNTYDELRKTGRLQAIGDIRLTGQYERVNMDREERAKRRAEPKGRDRS